MIKNIIFDWSGTLSDDAKLSHQITNKVLQHFDAEAISYDEYLQHFCIPVENFYHRYIDNSISRQSIDEIYMFLYDQSDLAALFEGVQSMLLTLQQRGFGLAVLSTVDSNILRQAIDYYQLPFQNQRIYGNAADKHEWIAKVLADGNFNADETLFVGDTVHDIEVGQQANVITGAACYGYSDEHQLKQLKPDYNFASIQAMNEQLDKDYLFNQHPLVLSTVGGIIQAQDSKKILLVQTRKWSNKWGTPGGKVDYGETLVQAFIREVEEETGIILDNARWVLTQEAINHPEFIYPQHLIMFNYFAFIPSECELNNNYESQVIGWFSIEQAMTMKLNQPTRYLLECPNLFNGDQ